MSTKHQQRTKTSETVFVVHHEHKILDGVDETIFIGVYSALANARKAVKRLTRQPGFSTSKTGFSIDAYELDEDHWTEGFITERWKEKK